MSTKYIKYINYDTKLISRAFSTTNYNSNILSQTVPNNLKNINQIVKNDIKNLKKSSKTIQIPKEKPTDIKQFNYEKDFVIINSNARFPNKNNKSKTNVYKPPLKGLPRIQLPGAPCIIQSNYLPPREDNLLNAANTYFKKSDIKFEASYLKFEDFPNENLRQEVKTIIDEFGIDYEFDNHILKKIKKSNIIDLPEVVLLGRCNVGKSSLINALIEKDLAKSSKIPGFTKFLNCFKIGSKFKLIDTPGYGKKGRIEQGIEIMNYLKNRKEFKTAFILIDSKIGLMETDLQVLGNLENLGIPYQIILTKMDKLSKEEEIKPILLDIWKQIHIINFGDKKNLACGEKIIMTTTQRDKSGKLGPGLANIRLSLLQSCNLFNSTTISKRTKFRNIVY